tara:strand:+ start:431 stop:3529 length:3099 start_codon:yes stop_codon:yes gene_type:complete
MGFINDSRNLSGYSNFSRSYTLDDLENDEKFQQVAERFLESVGEKSDDVFEYLRDSDFNLFSAMNRATQSNKFSQQQKNDYAYLRSKFDNADMGSLKQYFELIKDSATDIITDPTALTAAFLTPVTGGTSLAARQGIATAGIEASKAIAKNNLKDIGKSQIRKAAGITGAEVGAWTGLENHFRQNTEINTGLRQLYSNPELVGTTVLGTLTGGLFGGALQKYQLHNSQLSRLYSNDEYRKSAGSEILFKARKAKDTLLANTVGNPTRILKTISEFSPAARELGNKFSEEFGKNIGQRTLRRRDFSYFEDLSNTRGNFKLGFDSAIAPIAKTGKITPENELAVIRILRGGDDTGASSQVKQTAKNLREFFDDVLKQAEEAGLEPNKIENYFPRQWNRKAIEDDKPNFRKALLDNNIEGITEANVDDIISGMLNKQDELYSSHSLLLTQARVFKGMDDNMFEKYLTNDLVPVTTNYYMNAARTIEHKNSFLLPGKSVTIRGTTEDGKVIMNVKSNEEQFIERFINPIDQELSSVRGRGLTRKDKQRILNLYKSVTGQVDYFDNGLIQGFYDTTKLANAMAYLPLATLSSLSEAFITLGKAPVKSSVKGMQTAVANGHKIFTRDIANILKEKHNMSPDEITKEMNSIFIAVDEATADLTNRISGEGLQNEFLKARARQFYRFNLLIPWTKTVQLAAFSTGKDLIQENLIRLNTLRNEGTDILSDTAPAKVQNLTSELFDLGIEVEDGLRWLNAGAKQEDAFYNEQLIRGAGRFTNGIILPTSREAARVPTFMTNPKVDIFTQFLRYPTVFGNTVLKNFARDTINNPNASGPKVAAFVAISTNVAKASNYWRSSEENRERISSGEDAWKDTLKAYQRVGLLGPLEYGVRFTESLSYGQNPAVATANLGGPVLNDIVGITLYNRGLLETGARKLPFVGTKNLVERYTGTTFYDDIRDKARERDKNRRKLFREVADITTGREDKQDPFQSNIQSLGAFRKTFVTGGLIKGEYDVPKTKENAADRIDPFTGLPYSEFGG